LPGRQSRYSYFSLDTPRCSVEARDRTLSLRYHAIDELRLPSTVEGPKERQAGLQAIKVGNPFDRFQDWFGRWNAPRIEALPPFWGGVVGYFGYESSRYLEPKLSFLGAHTSSFPDFAFGLFDTIGAIDHARQRLWLVHTVLLPDRASQSPAQLEKMYR